MKFFISLIYMLFTSSTSLTIRYPVRPVEHLTASGRAKYQPYGPARIAATNSFDKWSRSQHFEDKSLYSRYFFGMMNGTVIESGAMVIE